MHPDLDKILFTEEQIKARVAQLGKQLSEEYADKEKVLVICILRGGVVFASDLMRACDPRFEIDFMAASSYGNSTQSSGIVRIKKDLDVDIKDYHVIISEDILDSGLTLRYLQKNLEARGPKSVEICTLLRKTGTQKAPIEPKYVGFECPDEFVVGYGLDYAEQYRGIPYIGVLSPRIYS